MVKIELNRVKNKPKFQCCNCKQYTGEISKVEIRKSKDFGDNTLYFHIDCAGCGCPIYLHNAFRELKGEENIVLEEGEQVSLFDEVKGIPKDWLNFKTEVEYG